MPGKSVQSYLNEEELEAFFKLKTWAALHNINPAENHLIKVAIYELCAKVGIRPQNSETRWKPDEPQVLPNRARERLERRKRRMANNQ